MNRRMSGGDASLNATMTEDGETEWLDHLVDDSPTQDLVLAEAEERAKRRKLLGQALAQLNARARDHQRTPAAR